MSSVLVLLGLLGIAVMAAVVTYYVGHKKEESMNKKISDLQKELEAKKIQIEEDAKKIKEAQSSGQNSRYSNSIVSQMPMGLILIDQNGLVVISNRYADMFIINSPPGGKPYKDVLNFQIGGKRDYLLFESAFMGKSQTLPDNSVLVTQRGPIPVSGNITQLAIDEDKKALLFTFFDNSKVVDRIQEQKEFFSTAAHELRTPLTGIGLTMAILRQQFDTLPREKMMDYITKTGEATEYLTKIVNDFLNLSRLDQGRLTVEKKSFNVIALADDVIKEINPLVKERKLFITHETIEDAYKNVVGDPVKAKEILMNLIANSIKYTARGGITISHCTTNTMMVTRITDTGNGIPEQSKALLFKRFTQVGMARQQSSTKSSGLGLYISKKIAQLMRGDVYLESSEPGKGTTFAFTLPLNLTA